MKVKVNNVLMCYAVEEIEDGNIGVVDMYVITMVYFERLDPV